MGEFECQGCLVAVCGATVISPSPEACIADASTIAAGSDNIYSIDQVLGSLAGGTDFSARPSVLTDERNVVDQSPGALIT